MVEAWVAGLLFAVVVVEGGVVVLSCQDAVGGCSLISSKHKLFLGGDDSDL